MDTLIICYATNYSPSLNSLQKIDNKLHYSVIGNLDYDAGCWRCHPTTSADCFKYKDIYCHPRAIAKTGNDDFTSKKVSLENVIS